MDDSIKSPSFLPIPAVAALAKSPTIESIDLAKDDTAEKDLSKIPESAPIGDLPQPAASKQDHEKDNESHSHSKLDAAKPFLIDYFGDDGEDIFDQLASRDQNDSNASLNASTTSDHQPEFKIGDTSIVSTDGINTVEDVAEKSVRFGVETETIGDGLEEEEAAKDHLPPGSFYSTPIMKSVAEQLDSLTEYHSTVETLEATGYDDLKEPASLGVADERSLQDENTSSVPVEEIHTSETESNTGSAQPEDKILTTEVCEEKKIQVSEPAGVSIKSTTPSESAKETLQSLSSSELATSPTNEQVGAETSVSEENDTITAPPPPNTYHSSRSTSVCSTDTLPLTPRSLTIEGSTIDRIMDSWLPSRGVREKLENVTSFGIDAKEIDVKELTTPGLFVDDSLGDPVKDLLSHYAGSEDVQKRESRRLTIDQVTSDVTGLETLISAGCYRSAVDLTGRLLTAMGQGKGRLGQFSTHSPETLQLWSCRISLLIRVQQFNLAQSELEAFSTFDRPDLYYEWYPEFYPERKGSMVPFALRFHYCQLPTLLTLSLPMLDRAYKTRRIITQMMDSVSKEQRIDAYNPTYSEKMASQFQIIWSERKWMIDQLIVNGLVSLKEYALAIRLLQSALDSCSSADRKSAINAAMLRITVQMGNINLASSRLTQNETSNELDYELSRATSLLCSGHAADAYTVLKDCLEQHPTAHELLNNLAVCSVYCGKLSEATSMLENVVHSNPSTYIHETVLCNLCTLYELQSSNAVSSKVNLLQFVSANSADNVTVTCLKLS